MGIYARRKLSGRSDSSTRIAIAAVIAFWLAGEVVFYAMVAYGLQGKP